MLRGSEGTVGTTGKGGREGRCYCGARWRARVGIGHFLIKRELLEALVFFSHWKAPNRSM